MKLDWLPRAIVPLAIALAFALFRKFAPAPPQPDSITSYDHQQIPEPLSPGAIRAIMWGIAFCLLLNFFLFRGANHLWAKMDGPATLRLYPPNVIWCFAPGFAALAIPWPLTVWLLRRLGRTDEADSVTAESSTSTGFDSFKIMKWLSIGIVGPIALFTLLATPKHLSISSTGATLGSYASLQREAFTFDKAKRAISIDGYRDRSGKLIPARDLLIYFANGRRLDANAGGDGGTRVRDDVVQLLLARTGLHPEHASTERDILPGTQN